MYHSITFTDISDPSIKANTWDDWHLIPASRPVVKPPEVNTKFIDIPGLNGSFDASELLTGYPTYKNRTGSWEFYVANDFWNWEVAYSTIMSFLHGLKYKCTLEDDPSYYYEGRFSVNDWVSEKTNSKITINYTLYPYKKTVYSSDDDWLWDPFNFEMDYIMTLPTITLGQTIMGFDIEYIYDEPVSPFFIFTGTDCVISFQHESELTQVTHHVTTSGTYKFPDVVMRKGTNTVYLNGNGSVSISYRGGRF